MAQNNNPDLKDKASPTDEGYGVHFASETSFPIVAIGASAGGLAALEAFFTHMPDEPLMDMAFILIQHLSPDYKSILPELLKKYTKWQVCDAQDGMKPAPSCIYVAPPNKNLIIQQGRLHLKEMIKPRTVRLPIDIFFRSLAQDQKERSACIILSGSGTDGTLGLKAIKGEGGMVMVQDPDSAQFKNMPCSAIATGLVDYVLPPEEMPGQLTSYLQRALAKKFHPVAYLSGKTRESLQDIFNLLHVQTGHDFSGYKKSTVTRRIDRRLAVNKIEHLDDYLRYLQQNNLEVETLFRELLVGVTNFFRDPEAFASLRGKIIPGIFTSKTPGSSVRIWVPGCSTGEEAYSLAILLKEHMEKLKLPYQVEIFATDIDKRAIELARQGLYPANITTEVSQERLGHFFIQNHDGNTYQIKKEVRDMLVFAEQNVTGDPPFSSLDLISCRNLLIFMERDLQEKVLHLFHYALKQDGFLFLGNSETTGELVDLFTTVDQKWKIYRKKETAPFRSTKKFYPFLNKKPSQSLDTNSSREKHISMSKLIEDILLQKHTPPCAVINNLGEILYIHGRTGKYLEPAPGEINMNIVQMAREGLKLELSAAIRKAAAQKKPAYYRGLKVKGNGATTTVNLTVSPISKKIFTSSAELFMVLFEETTPPEEEEQQKEAAAAVETTMEEQIAVLEKELRDKEEHLQTVIEELETSNEEMQSTNEELQSTNEELETSQEELQSVNEELMTVNMELQKKIDELSQANNDMNNMLTGTGIGIVFVDQQLRIKRFTSPAAWVLNLIPGDQGRPVNHITSNLVGYEHLGGDVQEVLDTLAAKEIEVRTKNDAWYLMRILPYRTMNNTIEGVVVTFIDITEQRQMQQGITRLAVIARDSNDAITMQNLEGQILAWNPGAEKMYGWSEAEALHMNIRNTIPESKREEALEVVTRLAQSKKLEPFKTERLTRSGKIIEVWMTASILLNKENKPYAIVTTERGII